MACCSSESRCRPYQQQQQHERHHYQHTRILTFVTQNQRKFGLARHRPYTKTVPGRGAWSNVRRCRSPFFDTYRWTNGLATGAEAAIICCGILDATMMQWCCTILLLCSICYLSTTNTNNKIHSLGCVSDRCGGTCVCVWSSSTTVNVNFHFEICIDSAVMASDYILLNQYNSPKLYLKDRPDCSMKCTIRVPYPFQWFSPSSIDHRLPVRTATVHDRC